MPPRDSLRVSLIAVAVIAGLGAVKPSGGEVRAEDAPPPQKPKPGVGDDLESLLDAPAPKPSGGPGVRKPLPDDGRLPPPPAPKIHIHVDPDAGVYHRFLENGKPSGYLLLGNPHIYTDEFSVKARTIVVWIDPERGLDLGAFPGGADSPAPGAATNADEGSTWGAGVTPGAAPGGERAGAKKPAGTIGKITTALDAVTGIYAEGAVELVKNDLHFRGVEMYLDPRRNQALIVEPRFDATAGTAGELQKPVPLHVRAARARILSSGYAVFDDGEVTTSRANDRVALSVHVLTIEEFGKATATEPLLLGFRAKTFEGTPSPSPSTSGSDKADAPLFTQHFVAEGITARAERVPIAYIPRAAFGGENGLTDLPTRIRRVQGGKRSSLGYYGFVGFGDTIGSRRRTDAWLDWTVDLGGYTKRGPAGGLELQWGKPNVVDGATHVFVMHDANGKDRTGYDAGEGMRGFVELENQWQISPHWRADAEVNVFTDRGVNREFFESDARDHKDRETYGRMRWRDGGAGAALTAGVHARDFVTESYGVPEATFWAESVPLPSPARGPPLDLSTEARVGRLVRRFDEATAQDGYEATRADVTERLYLPFNAGDLRFSPFVGGRWTGYSDRTDGGDDVSRGAMEAGFRGNLQLHRDFGPYGGPWALDGLRHVIDIDGGAYARFLDDHRPEDVPFFDRVDQEEERTSVFLEIHNRIETRRVVGEVRQNAPLLDARLRAEWWPKEIGPYGRRGPGQAEGWLSMELMPRTMWLNADALAAFEGASLLRSSIGILWSPHDDLSVAVGVRHVHDELLSPWFDVFYRWNEKWGVHFEAADDVYKSGDGSVRVSLLRFGDDHEWEIGMSLKDRGRDVGFFWNLLPLIGGERTRPLFQDQDQIVGAR